MKTAVDIADDFSDVIFSALMRSEQVTNALPPRAAARRERHVIDAAGFDADGGISFDGEFDFHYGADGNEEGHPALRAHIEGNLERDGDDWKVRRLQVESLQRVDAAVGPDELAS